MKKVDITFKKIDVTDYYPQLDQVVFRIVYWAGSDQRLIKQVPITDAEKLVQLWFKEIKERVRENVGDDDEDHPLSGVIAIGFTQDQDAILERMAKFVNTVKQQIESSKRAKLSYYDIDKEVRRHNLIFK